MIVDDVRSSRGMLVRWLAEQGIQAESEADGQQAWERLQAERYHLVVTDLEMPQMSGLDLLRTLRDSDRGELSKVPVIVVTSLIDHELSGIVHQFGGTTVMLKPLEKRAFIRVVEKVVAGETVQEVYDSTRAAPGGVATVSPSLRRLVGKLQR